MGRGAPREDRGLLSYGENGKVQLQHGMDCDVHTALLEPTPLQRAGHSHSPRFANRALRFHEIALPRTWSRSHHQQVQEPGLNPGLVTAKPGPGPWPSRPSARWTSSPGKGAVKSVRLRTGAQWGPLSPPWFLSCLAPSHVAVVCTRSGDGKTGH